MTVEFVKFRSKRVLPTNVLDFVLKDQHYGILSTEFLAAVEKKDTRNIIEGIESIILNAELKFNIKLSNADKLRIHMMAQDEIIKSILIEAEKSIRGDDDHMAKSEELKKLSKTISDTNVAISQALEDIESDKQEYA